MGRGIIWILTNPTQGIFSVDNFNLSGAKGFSCVVTKSKINVGSPTPSVPEDMKEVRLVKFSWNLILLADPAKKLI